MTRPLNVAALHRDDLLLDRLGRGQPVDACIGGDDVAALLAGWRADVVRAEADPPAAAHPAPAHLVRTRPGGPPEARPTRTRAGRRPVIVGLILAGALASAGGAAAASVGADRAGMLWSLSQLMGHRPGRVVVAAPAAPVVSPPAAPPAPVAPAAAAPPPQLPAPPAGARSGAGPAPAAPGPALARSTFEAPRAARQHRRHRLAQWAVVRRGRNPALPPHRARVGRRVGGLPPAPPAFRVSPGPLPYRFLVELLATAGPSQLLTPPAGVDPAAVTARRAAAVSPSRPGAGLAVGRARGPHRHTVGGGRQIVQPQAQPAPAGPSVPVLDQVIGRAAPR